jgi:hypothetical protein
MSPEKVEEWAYSGMYVLQQLSDLKNDVKGDRKENREEFKDINKKIDAMSKSIAAQKTTTRILLAISFAAMSGVLSLAFQNLF